MANQGGEGMELRWNIATLQGTTREETMDGERYIVAPAIGLVEGVHAGSKGPVYYPPHVIGRNVYEHNGAPLTLEHPEEGGQPISANSPAVMERQVIGRLFNFSFDPDGAKLNHEVWINERKAQTIAPDTVAAVRAGQQVELSTGLWTDDDGTPGKWRNEEYQASITAFRFDHEALLENGPGACSIQDGCGVHPTMNIRSTARTPSFEGKESTSWGGVKTTFKAYRDAYYKTHTKPDEVPGTVGASPSALKNWIASKTLLGDGAADNERDLIFFPVVNPRTNKLNEGALRAVISGRGAQADIPAAAKTSAQKKARSLLNKHFGAELEVQSMKDAGTIIGKFRELLRDVMHHDAGEAGGEGAEVDETAVAGNEEPKATGNAEGGSEMTKKDEAVAALIACDRTRFTDEHKDWLLAMEENQLDLLKGAEPCEETTTNTEQESEITVNTEEVKDEKAVTAEAYVANAPPEVRETLERAMGRDKAIKARLVKALVANKNCHFPEAELAAKPIGELERLTALARIEVNYEGRVGGGTTEKKTVPDPPQVFNLDRAAA